MTIGIAASGPNAGKAILEGLRALERVAGGAVGGFISLAAIDRDGLLQRCAAQDGGAEALLRDGAVPDAALSAERAVLMSSGPNRPEPLAQFTPADPRAGLVTGHRFPNNPDRHGVPLGEAVLALLREGWSARDAVEQITADNPTADAGLIALSMDGRMHSGNTAYVDGFADAGGAMAEGGDGRARVCILHNAIAPNKTLAPFLAEFILQSMLPPEPASGFVTMRRGTPLILAATTGLRIDPAGDVTAVMVADPRTLHGSCSLGIGYRAAVMRQDEWVGSVLYEPFIVVRDGAVASLDGAGEYEIPFTHP